MAEREDLLHQRAVVVAGRVVGLVRRAGDPAPVDGLAQFPVVRVGDDGHVGGLVELEQPARLARSAGPLRGRLEHHRRHARAPGTRRRCAATRRRPSRARSARSSASAVDSSSMIVLKRAFWSGGRCTPERRKSRIASSSRRLAPSPGPAAARSPSRSVELVEALVVAHLRLVPGDGGEAGVVGGAQLRRVGHRLQVADGRPDPVQPVARAARWAARRRRTRARAGRRPPAAARARPGWRRAWRARRAPRAPAGSGRRRGGRWRRGEGCSASGNANGKRRPAPNKRLATLPAVSRPLEPAGPAA